MTSTEVFWLALAQLWLLLPQSALFCQDSTATQIIAEGVGTTNQEALKDAFRNAIRQAVGTIVDAKTAVENDQIIEDKVLTFSDGFISSYEEISVQSKSDDKLVRVKIRASIKRQNLLTKLRSASLKTIPIDGKGLAAQTTTSVDNENEALELFKAYFENYPASCLLAEVNSQHRLGEKSKDDATLEFTIDLRPDLTACKALHAKVIALCSKISSVKQDSKTKFAAGKPDSASVQFLNGGNIRDQLAASAPLAFNGPHFREDRLTLTVMSNRTRAGDSIDFKSYVIDPKYRDVLLEVATRPVWGRLDLTDGDGMAVAYETFRVPSLIYVGGEFYGLYSDFSSADTKSASYKQSANLTQLFVLSSVFYKQDLANLYVSPRILMPVSIKLDIETLSRVKNASVEVYLNNVTSQEEERR